MTDPTPTLKPCRWCCGENVVLHHNPFWDEAFVVCRCGARGPRRDTQDAAIAAWNTRADDWRPIETAPKDGTRFLAYSQDLTGNNLPPFQSVIAWHDDAGFCTCELREPTHWRPLPAPPETTDD